MIVSTHRAALLFLLIALLTLVISTPAETQTTEVSILSYQAFNQLAQVYRSGGSAPNLVAQLNTALQLIEDARVERAQGDAGSAVGLENQARSIIGQVSPSIVGAQQEAVHNSTSRVQMTTIEAALVVGLSTFGFYGGLLIWRWYEREKLYEMKIIAEETEG